MGGWGKVEKIYIQKNGRTRNKTTHKEQTGNKTNSRGEKYIGLEI